MLSAVAVRIDQAYYRAVPEAITTKVYEILDERLSAITIEFMQRYCGEEAEHANGQVD
jgi:hypothetical protein